MSITNNLDSMLYSTFWIHGNNEGSMAMHIGIQCGVARGRKKQDMANTDPGWDNTHIKSGHRMEKLRKYFDMIDTKEMKDMALKRSRV